MAEFNIRSESVDVEQIMQQIRARIREKRGVDYTEEQVRELATVRLETFLDPRNLRSDLLEQFRKSRPALAARHVVEPPYGFDDKTLFASHRAIVRFFRRLLRPVLSLFFNPNMLNQILHAQARFNVELLEQKAGFDRSRDEWNVLYYEVLHNLVLETTRSTIEVKNLKMRLESMASRLDFSERRVRALEGVVQYRPEAVRPPRDRDRERERRPSRSAPGPAPAPAPVGVQDAATAVPETDVPESGLAPAPAGMGPDQTGDAASDATSRRRRRRRRGRRGSGQSTATEGGGPDAAADTGDDAGGGDEAVTHDAGDAPKEDASAEPRQDTAASSHQSSDASSPSGAADPDRP